MSLEEIGSILYDEILVVKVHDDSNYCVLAEVCTYREYQANVRMTIEGKVRLIKDIFAKYRDTLVVWAKTMSGQIWTHEATGFECRVWRVSKEWLKKAKAII
jgi:hypothetical protein